MRRLLVMASWAEMSLDHGRGRPGARRGPTGRPCWTKSPKGLVRQGHDPEQAVAMARELAQNNLWTIDVEPAL